MKSSDLGSPVIFWKIYIWNDHSLNFRPFFQNFTIPLGGWSWKKTFEFCSKNQWKSWTLNKTSTLEGNSEFLKKWSESQTVIISHINLSKNNWEAKIWRPHAFWHTLQYAHKWIWTQLMRFALIHFTIRNCRKGKVDGWWIYLIKCRFLKVKIMYQFRWS